MRPAESVGTFSQSLVSERPEVASDLGECWPLEAPIGHLDIDRVISPHMRTTIRIDDQLLALAKKHAARQGKTLAAVIEDALRAALARGEAAESLSLVRLTTVGGKGPRPGVDLDSTADLLDRMEPTDDAL